jgi:transposase-like protein
MKTTNNLRNLVEKLNLKDFSNLKQCVQDRDDRKKVANLLQNNAQVVCPKCHSERSVKNGVRNDLQRYKCKDCGRNYNILSGTPLARLRKKGRWLDYAFNLNSGTTLRQSATNVGVHRNTTFRWRHRFLLNANELKPDFLNGVVEAVESYFYYSEKGRKIPKFPKKIGTKVYVVFNRDRSRNVYDGIVNDFNSEKLKENFDGIYPEDILFCSENNSIYKEFSKELKLRHGSLRLKNGECVKKNVVHLFNATRYKEKLYDWMSRFKGVSTRYLSNYLSWYRELDEFCMDAPPEVLLLRGRSLDTNPYQPLTVPKAENIDLT